MKAPVRKYTTRNDKIPEAPSYADLGNLIRGIKKPHSKRLLNNALNTVCRARSRRPSDIADDLSDAWFENTIKVCRKWLTARKRSLSHCENIARGIRRLSSMMRTLSRRSSKKGKLILPKMFDLKNPNSNWGVHNLQNRVAKPYVLKRLPYNIEKQLNKYFEWRDGKNSRFLDVMDLSGKTRRLFAKKAWGRPLKTDDTKITESEEYTLEYIQGFFGFLSLPKNSDPCYSGLGIPVEKLKFGYLLCGKYAALYLEFLAVRADGELTTHAGNFERVWRQLVSGSESYGRWAQREFQADLINLLGRHAPRTAPAWHNWISEQSDIVEEAVARLSQGRTGRMRFRATRDPSVHLALLLEYKSPLKEIVWKTIHKLISLRQPFSDSEREKLTEAELAEILSLETMIFTLTAFTVAPFRLRNWTEMRWGFNLYLCPRGKWRFSIPAQSLKNRNHVRKGYEAEVQEVAQDIFTVYYKTWMAYHKVHPLGDILGKKPFFVMSLQKGKESTAPHRDTVRHRLLFLKDMWNITVGPNAFRHIVATDWLKSHPNDWDTVAGMLHDSVNVIMKAYAHLTAQDHIRRINEHNETHLGGAPTCIKKTASRRKLSNKARQRSNMVGVSEERRNKSSVKRLENIHQPKKVRGKLAKSKDLPVSNSRNASIAPTRRKQTITRGRKFQKRGMSPLTKMIREMLSLPQHR